MLVRYRALAEARSVTSELRKRFLERAEFSIPLLSLMSVRASALESDSC